MAPGDDTGSLRFGLLGPLEVVGRDGPVALGGPRQRALLALLLLHANQVVSRDRLSDLLWGDDPPATAANALQVAIHGLRRALGADRIETRGAGYVLRVEAGELDLERVERLLSDAAARPAAEAAAALREAESLWRGDGLSDLGEAPFARAEAARLEELRLAVLERRIDAELEDGRHAELLPELERLVRQAPERERFQAQLVLALYRAGRQVEALARYREARTALVEGYGVEPGEELRELERAVLRRDPGLAPRSRPRPVPGNLPAPLTALVGRELELAAVTGLLRRHDVRLVTLTGPGGTGKTRLALAAAWELAPELPDGACFADLAPLDDPDGVPGAIARALGVEARDGEELESALRRRALLLLLDNFERLTEAGPLVTRLLAAAPGVRVLATSRVPLRVTGEHEYPVPPLRVPSRDDVRRPDELARNEAVRLFVERARAVRHDFALSPADADAVAEICIALDGLPLALELAAARCRELAPAELAARLGRRLDALTDGPRDLPTRQRTLRATVEWSHELLEPAERALFSALGVFAGGLTAEAADAVCGAGEGALAGLVEKSLLARDEGDGGRRYRMLETVRELAVELLDGRADAGDLRRLHARYFAALAEEAGAALWGPVQGPERAVWLDRLEREDENLRAALAWAEREDGATMLRIAAALFDLWFSRSRYREGRDWLERALAREGAVEPAVRAKALHGAAFLALGLTDYAACERLGRDSLERYRALGDREGVGRTLHVLAQAAAELGDVGRALPLAEESLALARELGHARGIIVSLRLVGLLLDRRGRGEEAAGMLDEAARLAREHHDETALAALALKQAELALAGGDLAGASRLAVESVALFHAYGTIAGAAAATQVLALAEARGGRALRAAELLGAAEALRDSVGSPMTADDAAACAEAERLTREALGADEAAAARARSRSLRVGEAVALALAGDQAA